MPQLEPKDAAIRPIAQPTRHPGHGTSRREFLKTAVAGAAAATIGFSYVKRVTAQPAVVWKMQSGWPAREYFHESAVALANKINEMSAGRIRIDLLPAGAVVGAFGIIDAVDKGLLDAGHAVGVYAYAKSPATSLFGTGPSFGMDAIDVLSWFYYGGGFELYQDLLQNKLKLNVVNFLFGPMPTQPLGWFRVPVLKPEQFKGTKYRTVGLSAELYAELGASVVILPGGEIIPALERGVIDAAEFNNPSSDKALGFPDVRKVYMLGSFHQPVESLEVEINKAKWDALPPDLKAIVRYAIYAEGADFHYRTIARNSADLEELEKQRGVRVFVTPPEVLRAQLAAWDKIIEKHSKADPTFARIVNSQRAWARRVVSWKLRTYVDNRIAWDHYFKGK
ncbi:MAG: TRAP transporter substrate-binding protein [Armatimonadota bacterium]|nr:TRAP transporter substrate-binding protein [Armatimonadota bacterium]MDR7519231.1 TRAP transporter substrate-binding protein [Armatimonadota bacterium]MDR7550324.1 TRAP transporter substrate-binding protein [Armatimonadota bacterium]